MRTRWCAHEEHATYRLKLRCCDGQGGADKHPGGWADEVDVHSAAATELATIDVRGGGDAGLGECLDDVGLEGWAEAEDDLVDGSSHVLGCRVSQQVGGVDG